MQLIADIGGTSSRWLDLETGMSSLLKLKGFNPVANRGAGFIAGIERLDPENVHELSIYGAGCGSEVRRQEVKTLAQKDFPNATINVQSDLLAVARALFGNGIGMVAILGTGMNVAHYDGEKLHQRVPSLGYLLGDEGGGSDIGKHFLNDFFNARVPIELIVKVFPNGNPALAKTISEVYGHEAQNRALATYTKALAGYQDHAYVQALVGSAFKRFTDLIAEHHPRHETQRIGVSGGVAAGFEGILKPALKEIGAKDISIVADPLEGLLNYHRSLTPTRES